VTKEGHFTTAMFAHMPIIRDIIYGAVARGADLHELCARLNLPVNGLNDSEKTIDFETSYLTWEYAVKMTHDPLLGLHIGESTNPSVLGLIGHLMQSSPDLISAFRNVCQYAEVATDMFQYQITEQGNKIFLRFEPTSVWLSASPQSAKQAVEQAMAGTLHVFYLLSGREILPAQTKFNYKRTTTVSEHERIFSCPLSFNAGINELTFERAQLEVPVLSYDRSLFSVFDRMLKEKKERKNLSLSTQLKQIMLTDFKGQVPSIDILSSKLHLTSRSLQRKLKEEKTNFRQVAKQFQSEVAVKLLASPHTKIKEVSHLLGYSEVSAFRRAYKSWTSKTPSQARRK
jgi:AraC-like DNA-binding protein